jgi:hypothetical protein
MLGENPKGLMSALVERRPPTPTRWILFPRETRVFVLRLRDRGGDELASPRTGVVLFGALAVAVALVALELRRFWVRFRR